jgi:hypothetical protein
MFCFQCQETAKNTGCTVKGMCGKPEETANLQDLLIFVLRGIAVYGERLKELGQPDRSNDDFVLQALFATITNANWDDARFMALIQDALARRDASKIYSLPRIRPSTARISRIRCPKPRLGQGTLPVLPKRPKAWASLPRRMRMCVPCARC